MHIWIGNYFYKGSTRPVVVYQRVVMKVRKFAYVFFQMYAGKLYGSVRPHLARFARRQFYFNAAAKAQRLVELRKLVVFGAVGVEIVFSVPLGYFGNFATKQHTHFYGFAYCLEIKNGQNPRQSQNNWVYQSIWLFAKAVWSRRKHFAFCMKLNVNFQTYYCFKFHNKKLLQYGL